jgi:hypothetical protein
VVLVLVMVVVMVSLVVVEEELVKQDKMLLIKQLLELEGMEDNFPQHSKIQYP